LFIAKYFNLKAEAVVGRFPLRILTPPTVEFWKISRKVFLHVACMRL